MGDDHARQALLDLFRQAGGLEIVGEAANDVAAIALTVSARPDVVVLDRELPTMSGIEALIQTLKRESGAQVIIRGGERPPWSNGSRLPEGTVWVSGQAPLTELEVAAREVAR